MRGTQKCLSIKHQHTLKAGLKRQTKRLLAGNFEVGRGGKHSFAPTRTNPRTTGQAITEPVTIYGHLARVASQGQKGLREESLGWQRPGEAHPGLGEGEGGGASTPHRDYLSARYCACG